MREEEKDEISAAAEGGGWSSFFVSMMSSGVDEEIGKSLNFSLPLSDLSDSDFLLLVLTTSMGR